MPSFYHQHSGPAPDFDAWPSERSTHTVVIGGGFAGVNTALGLAERGIACVLLEQQQIGFGASGRNGGFVFAGFSLGERALLQQMGPELARAWYLRTQAAVDLIRARILHYQIACDCLDAGVLWVNRFTDDNVLRARQALLAQHFDTHWQHLGRAELAGLISSERYSGALFERNAMQLNPLKLVRGLAQAAAREGAKIVEHTPVLAIEKLSDAGAKRWRVRCAQGHLDAENVVLACGGYMSDELARSQNALRRAVMPIATYVIATEALGARLQNYIRTQAAIYDTRFAFDYYRASADSRLIWGGRIHTLDAPTSKVERLLRKDLAYVFPELAEVKIEHSWSGMMSYARHEMPQIGQREPGLWHAQAFGGHGLAPCCVAGETLAQAIASGEQHYQQLAQFGLVSSFGALGKLGAQCTYWWLQTRDWWQERKNLPH